MRDLCAGMNGPDVRALQEGLNLRNDGVASPIAVDGSFGPETDNAIRAYQAP
ncbi:MAG TPA: peptidoglycan-binding domain-containing protein [Candidatus Acidoferrum sp.]|nr:peptidoglycan-binding domain-containing protein [Candidatus Acidoferrum sp.]